MSEKEKKNIEIIHHSETTHAEINKEKGTVHIVRNEEVSGKDNVDLVESFSERMNIPVFKSLIKHAYESDFLGYKDKCPRCQAVPQTMISNFAYATDTAGRIMTGPAGHFCPDCPTVIIDDDMVRSAARGVHKYHGVYVIETGYEKENIFTTLNGEKAVYILSEDKQKIGGIAQSVHRDKEAILVDPTVYDKAVRSLAINKQNKKSSNKRKTKAARKARKRNRKR